MLILRKKIQGDGKGPQKQLESVAATPSQQPTDLGGHMLARRFGRNQRNFNIAGTDGLRRTLLPAITNINTMFSGVENIGLIASRRGIHGV